MRYILSLRFEFFYPRVENGYSDRTAMIIVCSNDMENMTKWTRTEDPKCDRWENPINETPQLLVVHTHRDLVQSLQIYKTQTKRGARAKNFGEILIRDNLYNFC